MKNLRGSIQGAVMAAMFRLFKGNAAADGSSEKDAGVRALKSVLGVGAKAGSRLAGMGPQVNHGPGSRFRPRRSKQKRRVGAHAGRRAGPTWKSEAS